MTVSSVSPWHVLHHDEENVRLFLRCQDRDDVRMVQRGQQAGLAEQVAEVDVLPVGNLDGDFLVDPGVFGEVNSAESAAAEWRQDFVLSDGLTAEKHWGEYTGMESREESGSRKSQSRRVVVPAFRPARAGRGAPTNRARCIEAPESPRPLRHRRARPATPNDSSVTPAFAASLISCVSQPPSGPINTMASDGRCPSRPVTSAT